MKVLRNASRYVRVLAGVALAVLVGTAAAVGATTGWHQALVVLLAPLVTLTLLLDVPVPLGGSIPLGYTLVVGLAAPLTADAYALVVALALLLAAPFVVWRDGRVEGARVLRQWTAGAVGAGVVTKLAVAGLSASANDGVPLLACILAGGLAFIAVDLGLRRTLFPGSTERLRTRAAWPVYVSVICGAALFGMAYHRGVWMAMIALCPLLLTRFAFVRYDDAQRTYRQTIQALSIVPEVAGLVRSGHGERTATYAAALADAVGLDPVAKDRAITAARLHHIGAISLDELEEGELDAHDAWAVARLGADILRETTFLRAAGDIVEQAERGVYGRSTLEVAIVRVASRFDDLVGDDPGKAAAAVSAVALQNKDKQGRRVVAALRRLLLARPDLVGNAVRGAQPLTRVQLPDMPIDLAYQD